MCLGSSRTALPLKDLADREGIRFIRAALFFPHDMEHQAEGSQESSLGSIEILSMYVMLHLLARPVPETPSESTELLLALFAPVMPG